MAILAIWRRSSLACPQQPNLQICLPFLMRTAALLVSLQNILPYATSFLYRSGPLCFLHLDLWSGLCFSFRLSFRLGFSLCLGLGCLMTILGICKAGLGNSKAPKQVLLFLGPGTFLDCLDPLHRTRLKAHLAEPFTHRLHCCLVHSGLPVAARHF